MNTITVLGPWGTKAGPKGPCNVPQLVLDYPAITAWAELDGVSPPTPCRVQAACDNATLALIAANPTYTVL